MEMKSTNKFILLSIITVSFIIISLAKPVYPQSTAVDSSFHPYHINYWVTGGIILGGLALEKIGVAWISDKSPISFGELQNLNRHDITPIDSWALNFAPSNKDYYDKLSTRLASICPFLPLLTLLDHKIREDWLDMLMMYLQTQAIVNNFYLYSPFGATFQNRMRPIVYYQEMSIEDRSSSNNRNSLYSGHVATAAAASFFTAKVYCDYHPELGWKKYLIYGAATIPPLLMGYFRLGVGALCGILVPQFHRTQDKNIELGLFTNYQATGISIIWKPDF